MLPWRAWGYEWRRTKRREKQLAGTLLHLSHELQSCPSHGHTVTVLGLLVGGPWSDPCSFGDRWCGHSGGLLGAQCRVSRTGDSGAGAAGVCGRLVGDQGGVVKQFSDIAKGVVAELGKKFEKRVRDVEKLSDLAKVR